MKIGLVMPVGWGDLGNVLPDDIRLPAPLEFPFGSKLAVVLHSLGHEVHVFTLCHFISTEIHTECDGFHVHIAGYRDPFRMCYLDGFRVESTRLKKMMREWPCDIYNAHWQYEFARPVVEAGVPHVVTVRDNPWKVLWLFRPKSFRLMKLVLAYYVISKAKKLSVASPYMAGYLKKWHNVKGIIPVIPNAVPLFDSSSLIRKKSDGKIVFVDMANGFSACKNVKNLLRAFAIVRSELGSGCELHLYGNGYGSGEICEAWAKRAGLERQVVFWGCMRQKEMHKRIYETADVFVHSSREESFGGVIVEAMGMGLPTIVGRRSGACPWVAGNGETGLLVDVNNPREIAEAMLKMAKEPDARAIFSESSIRRAHEVFSLESIARQYLKMYENIVS